MTKDLLFIGALIIGLFFVWLFIGPSLLTPTTGGGSSVSSPSFSSSRSSSRSTSRSDTVRASSYAGMVTISRARATEEKPREEYIEIKTSRKNTSPINISGWKLIGTSGAIVKIGKAALLPAYHNTSSQSPVILEPNDIAYVVSGTSPVQTSFRTSICTGYFEEHKSFYPRLRLSCPAAYKEDLDQFGINSDPREGSNDEKCIRELRRIRKCTDPSRPDEEKNLSRDCENYINDVGYDMCVDLHKDDSNFRENRWYLYAGNIFNDLWDDDTDTITLIDNAGQIVDFVSY